MLLASHGVSHRQLSGAARPQYRARPKPLRRQSVHALNHHCVSPSRQARSLVFGAMPPDSDSQHSADPVRRSLDALRGIVRALRTTAATTERQFGISTAQLDAIECLMDSPCDSIQELAERTRTHPTSVTGVVHRLAERGLVNREPHAVDKRRTRILLTDTGRTVMAAAPPTVWRQLRVGLQSMRAEDQRALADLLVRWSAPLSAAEAPHTE